MIAARLRRKPAAGFDPITKGSGRSLELSVGGRGVIPLLLPNAFDQQPHFDAPRAGFRIVPPATSRGRLSMQRKALEPSLVRVPDSSQQAVITFHAIAVGGRAQAALPRHV